MMNEQQLLHQNWITLLSYCENIKVPAAVWDVACSNLPYTLGGLSEKQPTLIVFLRHLGCTFCRQALADLKKYRQEIEGKGVQLSLIHMVEDDKSSALFEKYGLGDLPRFSDPEKIIYQGFGLKRGGVSSLLGLSVWLKGFRATVLEGNLPGAIQGDVGQLPGVFLLRQRRVIAGYIHDTAADRPDYCRIADQGLT
jgi:thiol-disulfide isomerase/thioredoxin